MRLLHLFLLNFFLIHSVAHASQSSDQEEIGKFSSYVARDGEALLLSIDTGEKIMLRNGSDCNEAPDDCIVYNFKAMVADGQFFWVEARYYEGRDTFLISRKTGRKVEIFAEPHLSPDGRYIVAASDAEAYDESGLFLWSIDDGELIEQFARLTDQEDGYVMYQFRGWDGLSNRVNLTVLQKGDAPACGDALAYFPAALSLGDNGWQLSKDITPEHAMCSSPDKATQVMYIDVYKSERIMQLRGTGNRVIKTYRIALGGNPLGHKTTEGDEKTPEGYYQISDRRIGSRYFRALKLSYPNEEDRKQAEARGVSPGSNIMIHGLPNGFSWIGEHHLLYDRWTDGCIGVTNAEMGEIWALVANGTTVRIMP